MDQPGGFVDTAIFLSQMATGPGITFVSNSVLWYQLAVSLWWKWTRFIYLHGAVRLMEAKVRRSRRCILFYMCRRKMCELALQKERETKTCSAELRLQSQAKKYSWNYEPAFWLQRSHLWRCHSSSATSAGNPTKPHFEANATHHIMSPPPPQPVDTPFIIRKNANGFSYFQRENSPFYYWLVLLESGFLFGFQFPKICSGVAIN